MTRLPVVDGATRLVGIVGHPIAQVRAPETWTGMFHHHGLNMLCVPFNVVPADLPVFFDGMRKMRNLAGMIVTIPHKPATVDLVDELTERARLVRSVNFISVLPDGRWLGDIVDGTGFVGNLMTNGVDPRGMRTLLVGAGGVGTAIAYALADAGVSELRIHDQDQARAAGLAERLQSIGKPAGTGSPEAKGFDLIVNASPVGMREDDPLHIDLAGLKSGSVVADAIVHETLLLRSAATLGCRTLDGRGMMEHQFVPMAEHLGLGNLDFSPETTKRVAATVRG